MVATSASRAWMSHDTGNIDLRMRWPTMKTKGMVNMATKARATLIESMKPKATRAMLHCTRIIGAKVMYICTERMSELAREMSWPDWTRS